MAIIVEDGTSLENSNSYNSESELLEYAAAREVTLTKSASYLLIKSMDVMETWSYLGIKTKENQGCQFPRFFDQGDTVNGRTGYSSTVTYGLMVDGYPVYSNVVPKRVKKAQLEICLALEAGTDLTKVRDRVIKREKVGPVDIEYADYKSEVPSMPVVDKLLEPFLEETKSSVVKLLRS